MQPIGIFFLGLPGAGKSTIIKEIVSKESFDVVSADLIKERLTDDTQLQSSPEIHEQSVQEAKKVVLDIASKGLNFIMDGGGINNSYTLNIIKEVKNRYGYFIKVIYVDTPVDVCVQRNIKRNLDGERYVPKDDVYRKAQLLPKAIARLNEVADEFERYNYFTGEVLFVDMDGTVANYHNIIPDQNGNIDFTNNEMFKYSRPVMPVILALEYAAKNGIRVCILSASPNSICNEHKREWLTKHMSFVKPEDIFFCGNKEYKHIFASQLITKLKLKPNQVTVIDDDHMVLRKMNEIGVNPMHVSTLLSDILEY